MATMATANCLGWFVSAASRRSFPSPSVARTAQTRSAFVSMASPLTRNNNSNSNQNRKKAPRLGARFASSLSSSDTDTQPTTKNAKDSSNAEIEWPTSKVRSTFVDFFADKYDHFRQPSSACAPLNDPTLLFTNAGMNQYKPIFLGQTDPSSPLAQLTKATNSQKCIRAGGKHNDLEDVGRDTYHHTFFEMLGSWSFGDYFKKEAIDYAWELLTEVYKLNPDRIYATYFEGSDEVEVDAEARDFWLKYLPADRVIPCNAEDNFWEVGFFICRSGCMLL